MSITKDGRHFESIKVDYLLISIWNIGHVMNN